jgi:hypothetical protein
VLFRSDGRSGSGSTTADASPTGGQPGLGGAAGLSASGGTMTGGRSGTGGIAGQLGGGGAATGGRTGTGGVVGQTGGATTGTGGAGAGGTRQGGAGGTLPSGSGGTAGAPGRGGSAGADASVDAPGGEVGGNGDKYGPWAGGSTYYGSFTHGPPSDPSFFPIAVWLQDPSMAQQYAGIGINIYVGLWQGPTEDQLSALTSAAMPVACDQNDVGIAHVNDDIIVMWTQQDEPDNAQSDGSGGYGPCIPATQVQSIYDGFKAKDKTRPVLLNLGQGVANIPYVGWGSECSKTHPGDYPDYIKGSDIISFDIYPANSTYTAIKGNLDYVARGVDNLITWTGGAKPVWNWIECTGIDDVNAKPTPEQVKAEVWMSIVHGSMGIGYFVHQFTPFDEHALLDDPTMKTAVGAVNQQIHDLAPVLNTPPIINAGTVTSSDANVPVDMLIKRLGQATYLFAVAMRGSPAKATFSGLTNLAAGAAVEVIGEKRTIALSGNSFQDDFAAWGVHLYKMQ